MEVILPFIIFSLRWSASYNMQKDGLVRAECDAKDKRFVNVMLTDKGQKTLARAAPVARGIVSKVMSSVGERSVHQLMKSLSILRQNAYEGLSDLSKHTKV
jgi:DNA-binding MarR family transcriptional regulator